MKSLIKKTLTEEEKKNLYEIGKQYYFDKKIGPNKKEWLEQITINYHGNPKEFQIVYNENQILGYTISSPIYFENQKWRKIIEGGISETSKNKIKDFVKMFDFLKTNENLLIEVGENESKMYHVLMQYCNFEPLTDNNIEKLMKVFLQENPFTLSRNENNEFSINRKTRHSDNYNGKIITYRLK